MQIRSIVHKFEHIMCFLFITLQIGVCISMKTEYRNAVRSRRLICEALLELLDEKPLEKITVTDIAHRADISRGTFYLHYDSVRSVISELQDAYLSHMDQFFDTLEIPFTPANTTVITAECLRFIYRQHPEKNILLLLHQQNSFAEKICQSFQNRILKTKEIPQDREIQKQIMVQASILIHGILGTYQYISAAPSDLSVADLTRAMDGMEQDLRILQELKSNH